MLSSVEVLINAGGGLDRRIGKPAHSSYCWLTKLKGHGPSHCPSMPQCFASPGGSTRFAPPRATVEDGPNDGLTACRDLDAGSHGRTREVKRSTPRLPLAHLVQTGSLRLQTGHPQTAVHEDPSGRDHIREPTRHNIDSHSGSPRMGQAKSDELPSWT